MSEYVDCPACMWGRVDATIAEALGYEADTSNSDDNTTICPFCDGTDMIETEDLDAAREFARYELAASADPIAETYPLAMV